jgi:hypothetical protein
MVVVGEIRLPLLPAAAFAPEQSRVRSFAQGGFDDASHGLAGVLSPKLFKSVVVWKIASSKGHSENLLIGLV